MMDFKRGDVVIRRGPGSGTSYKTLWHVEGPADMKGMVAVSQVSSQFDYGRSLPSNELELVGFVDPNLRRRGHSFFPTDMSQFDAAITSAARKGLQLNPDWCK